MPDALRFKLPMAMGSDDSVAEALGYPITQLQPTSDAEAAILATLVPGNYTVIVRGQGDTPGVALVEACNPTVVARRQERKRRAALRDARARRCVA